MELLRATGGRQVTDSYYFVQPPKYNSETMELSLEFYVAGWRHYKADLEFELYENMSLMFNKENNNPKDDRAVSTVINNKVIGYVPTYYSEYVWNALDSCNFGAKIISIDKFAKPQIQVLVETCNSNS